MGQTVRFAATTILRSQQASSPLIESLVLQLGFILLLTMTPSLRAQDRTKEGAEPMSACGENIVSTGRCSTEPFPLSTVRPVFSDAAKHLMIEGHQLVISFVVGKDGSARDIHILNSLGGGGGDEAAVAAVSQWRFEPGTYEGSPVAVRSQAVFGQPLSAAKSEQFRKLSAQTSEALGRHDFRTAATLARTAITLAPYENGIRVMLGAALVGLNELDAAQAVLEAEIKLDPASPTAYRLLGVTYLRQHKLEDAVTQFRKQIAINPQDHDAYAALASLLHDEKQCSAAIPELDKALAISPTNPATLLTRGLCYVDLGNTARGVSDLEQAVSGSPDPVTLYEAAYSLADNNVELEHAMKWGQAATTIETARLSNLDLKQLTPAQFRLVSEMAKCWHTLGWIYFRRGDLDQARAYVEGAWSLRPRPMLGYHLGQIYEKLRRPDDAARTYAMTIAAAELPSHEVPHPEVIVQATSRLRVLSDANADSAHLIERGKVDLDAMREVSVANGEHCIGIADFEILVKEDEVSEAQQLSGDTSLGKCPVAILNTKLPVRIPGGRGVQIPRRGTLTCVRSGCRLSLLWDEQAFEIARKEASSGSATLQPQ
jgi:TonB family protein